MILEYKFSTLGQFESLESTPELLAKLQAIYVKYKLMPNNIMMQEISNMGMKTKYRPQLIDTTSNMSVDFLPDRIDISFKTPSEEFDSVTKMANDIFDDIESVIDIKPNRFATIVQGILNHKNDTDIFNRENYFKTERFIEWSTRTVHRKTIELNGKQENLNIVLITEKPENPITFAIGPNQKQYEGAIYSIDINTFLPSTSGLFNFSDFREFNSHILDEINNAKIIIESLHS